MFVKDDVIEIVAGELYSAALYCGMLPQKHDNTHAHIHTHTHTHTFHHEVAGPLDLILSLCKHSAQEIA
jgi:hypothetical protein